MGKFGQMGGCVSKGKFGQMEGNNRVKNPFGKFYLCEICTRIVRKVIRGVMKFYLANGGKKPFQTFYEKIISV